MKINENLVLTGPSKVRLVPYLPEHVPRYHEWMKDPFLQETTASEPLTLDEEYEMCRNWREDEDKLTFIIYDLSVSEDKEDRVKQMCGDINLFLNDDQDRTRGELELMVAEPGSRRKGIGEEALVVFMAYCVGDIGIRTFRVQIGEDNAASIALFTKVGFQEVGRSDYFKEVHLELAVEGDLLEQMLDEGSKLKRSVYQT